MKDFISYLKSKTFLRTLVYMVTLAFTLFMVLLISLRIYTHHNPSIVVPDFSDLPVDVAAKLIDSRHLRYEIFDSIYVTNRDPGVVIDQHPKPGFLVKKNRKVYLTINANSPEKIVMPDLLGITLREARNKITIASLRLGKLSYRYSIAKNVVLEQQLNGKVIDPGDTLLKGSSIDLVLGKGLSDEKSSVPDLIGLTVEQAINKASDYFFTINTSIPDETVKEGQDIVPFIYRHHPAHSANVQVPLGTQITVWVTTDSTKLPGFAGSDTSNYAWPELNEGEHVEVTEDDSYDYDYPD